MRCSLLVRGIQAQPQLRIEAMQLGFVIHDAGLRDVAERLRYQAQSLPQAGRYHDMGRQQRGILR